MFTTKSENDAVMKVMVQSAENLRAPSQHRLQYWIIFFVGRNDSSLNLRVNQFREILECLCVFLDFHRRQRPDRLQSRIVQNPLRFTQKKRRQNQYMFCGFQNGEQ